MGWVVKWGCDESWYIPLKESNLLEDIIFLASSTLPVAILTDIPHERVSRRGVFTIEQYVLYFLIIL